MTLPIYGGPRVRQPNDEITSSDYNNLGAGVEQALTSVNDTYRIKASDVVGLSDATPTLLAAITAAQSAGAGRVLLPPGILNMATALVIPSTKSVVIEGTGDDTVLRQMVTSYPTAMITGAGAEGSKVALTTTLTAGTLTLTLPTAVASTLAVGDTVGFESTLPVFGTGLGTQVGNASEYRKVEAVSGTTVTVDGPLLWTYTAADSGTCYKVNLAPQVVLRNLRITTDNPTTHTWRALYLSKMHRPIVENITLDNAGGGLFFLDCYGGEVNGVTVNRLETVADFRGYGVSVMGRSAEMFVNALVGRNVRHLFTTLADQRGSVQWGGPRNIQIRGGVGYASLDATGYTVFDTHPYGIDILFDSCRAYGGAAVGANGFQIRSLRTTLAHCGADRMGGCGVTITGDAVDVDIDGGRFSRNGLQGIKVAAPDVRIHGATVDGNTNQGVSYNAGSLNLQVRDNTILDNGATGVRMGSGTIADTGVVITGNTIPASARQTQSVNGCRNGATVAGNILRGYGTGADGTLSLESGVIKAGNIND